MVDESQSEVASKVIERMRSSLPSPPQFSDKLEERAYLKFRLAQALRIFGRRGYDEGVAGHITVRVGLHYPAVRDISLKRTFLGSHPTRLLLGQPTGELSSSNGRLLSGEIPTDHSFS